MMKKYISSFIIMCSLNINSITPCPCGFSPDDKRPFFEQYDTETHDTNNPKKEKPYEKDDDSYNDLATK